MNNNTIFIIQATTKRGGLLRKITYDAHDRQIESSYTFIIILL